MSFIDTNELFFIVNLAPCYTIKYENGLVDMYMIVLRVTHLPISPIYLCVIFMAAYLSTTMYINYTVKPLNYGHCGDHLEVLKCLQ